MRVAWVSGLALVVLAANPARGDEWSHQYALKGRPELHVKTDDGSVRIETGAGSEIDARVTTVGWRIAPGEVTITESQTGDRVDIEVRLPKDRHGFGTGHRSITVALRVPKQADLNVHTGDGSIEVQPVSGQLDLSTGDGSITADGLQGGIRLHTGDGSIRATGLSGRLEADTGDGQWTSGGGSTSWTFAPVTAGSRPRRSPGPGSRRRGRSAAATGASRCACPRAWAPTSTPTRATAASSSTSR